MSLRNDVVDGILIPGKAFRYRSTLTRPGSGAANQTVSVLVTPSAATELFLSAATITNPNAASRRAVSSIASSGSSTLFSLVQGTTLTQNSSHCVPNSVQDSSSGLVAWYKLDENSQHVPTGSEIVTNGEFETYTTSPDVPFGWSDNSGGLCTFTKETTIVRSGSNSLKILSGVGGGQGLRQTLTLTADTTYIVEVWGRSAGNGRPHLVIRNTTDNVVIRDVPGTTNGLNWERLSAVFSTETGKTYQIQIQQASGAVGGEVVYFDDVSVKKSTTAVNNGFFDNYTTTPAVPPGWGLNVGATTDISKETTIIRSGPNALKVTNNGGGATTGLFQALTLTAGKSYYVEAWARTSGAAGEVALLRIDNATDVLTVVSSSITTTTTWTKLSGTFATLAGKTYQVKITQSGGTTGHIVYFDDVLVKEVVATNSGSLGAALDGTIKGAANTSGPQIEVSGKYGNCYDFDGVDDSISMSSITLPSTFTFTQWINADALTGGPVTLNIGIASAPSNFLISAGGAVRFAWQTSSGVQDTTITSAGTITVGSWFNIIGTHDGTTARIYVNGVELVSKTSPCVSGSGPITIGSFDTSLFFNGKIDDTRIYNRALSASEVGALYHNAAAHRIVPGGSVGGTDGYKFELQSLALNEAARFSLDFRYFGKQPTVTEVVT